jgi:hypothetical protein
MLKSFVLWPVATAKYIAQSDVFLNPKPLATDDAT